MAETEASRSRLTTNSALVPGDIYNYGNGQPPTFNAGTWYGGATSEGADGTPGKPGSATLVFSGAPATGSLTSGTWVRENAALKLGDPVFSGGNGAGRGGAGGGGLAGGGGAGDLGGGGGGASYAVGSSYGLTGGDTFAVPCEVEGFCAQNWLSPASTEQPVVVVTFWSASEASPIVPKDGETIDTDQPSLVFLGQNAQDATQGIYYTLTNTISNTVNFTGLINNSATGNLLWTVPAGVLVPGQTYAWQTTNQAGKTLQDSQTFTVAKDTVASGLTQGWTLYVRSMDTIDTSLPADLEPLANQPVPTVSTSCSCLCSQNDLSLGNNPLSQWPTLEDSEYPSCSGYISNHSECDCNYNANGAKPTASNFWVWTPASGASCTSNSGSCYANAEIHLGAIDVDWASPSNSLGLQVPSRLINLTSEPNAPTNGSLVPSLAVPAMEGFSGNCADDSQVEVTFTAQTNGGLRFFVYADPSTGAPASSPASTVNDWDIPSCSWAPPQQHIGSNETDQIFPIDYMQSQVYLDCQTPLKETTGANFCLTPETPYRVRFDAVVPYLPGPMQLGFKLAGMDTSAPVPTNWISTCALDSSSQNCASEQAAAPSSSGQERPFAKLGHPPRGTRRGDVGEDRSYRLGSQRPSRVVKRVVATSTPPDEGANGATSCTALGGAVQCIWDANGTWELPAAYTQDSNGWVVIQALGGHGGAGYPTYNPGGPGGRAQAALPATSLAGETLYLYVGDNGPDISFHTCNRTNAANGCILQFPAGGAASMVSSTAIPDDFIGANNCHGDPDDLDLLVIAGGGAGGGINGSLSTAPSKGGAGGSAIGGSGRQHVIGMGYPGTADQTIYTEEYEPDNAQIDVRRAYAGQAPMYGNNPYDGTDTVRGGLGAYSQDTFGGGSIAFAGSGNTWATTWVKNSSVLTLPTQSKNNNNCSGGLQDAGGSGAGGLAGGGGGTSTIDDDMNTAEWKWTYGAGGGGGSSWAVGAGPGISNPYTDWQSLEATSSQVVVTIHCASCGS